MWDRVRVNTRTSTHTRMHQPAPTATTSLQAQKSPVCCHGESERMVRDGADDGLISSNREQCQKVVRLLKTRTHTHTHTLTRPRDDANSVIKWQLLWSTEPVPVSPPYQGNRMCYCNCQADNRQQKELRKAK